MRRMLFGFLLVAFGSSAVVALAPQDNKIAFWDVPFAVIGGAPYVSLARRFGWSLTPEDFGAKCDGLSDDSTALNKWLAALAPGSRGALPPGTCAFQSPLTINNANISISGAGAYESTLLYQGVSSNVDLLSVGDGKAEKKNITLSDFRISSQTMMKGGAALHAKLLVRSRLDRLVIDGQDGEGKLYNGLWLDRVDVVAVYGGEARAQNDAVRINGAVGAGPKADVFLSGGYKIGGSGVGIRVGGAFGGLFVDDIDVIDNGTNVIIDTSLAPEANRELFFGSRTALDSSTTGPGVLVADMLGGGQSWLSFSSPWIASSHTCGVQINAGVNYVISFVGGTIFNNKTDGICNSSQSSRINVDSTVRRDNGRSGSGYGFNSTVANSSIGFPAESAGVTSYGNASGDFNGITPKVSNFSSATIANGGNFQLAGWSGLIAISNTHSGDVGVYACGGGVCTLITSTMGTWAPPTRNPSAGKSSVASNGSAYTIYNNSGASALFTITVVSARNGP